MKDLLSLSCADTVRVRLNTLASYVEKRSQAFQQLAIVDPQATLADLRKLEDELHEAFSEIRCDLAIEAERRRPKPIELKLHNPCDIEDTSIPESDIAKPVGAFVVTIGVPVEPSNRTGA